MLLNIKFEENEDIVFSITRDRTFGLYGYNISNKYYHVHGEDSLKLEIEN